MKIFAQNIDCVDTLDQPRRDDSNQYPQSKFGSNYKKNKCAPVNPSLSV